MFILQHSNFAQRSALYRGLKCALSRLCPATVHLLRLPSDARISVNTPYCLPIRRVLRNAKTSIIREQIRIRDWLADESIQIGFENQFGSCTWGIRSGNLCNKAGS